MSDVRSKNRAWRGHYACALEVMGPGWFSALAMAGAMKLSRPEASALLRSMKRKGLVESSGGGLWRAARKRT